MKRRILLLAAILIPFSTFVHAQTKSDPWLDSLIRKSASPALLHVLDHPDTFHYQLIYTRIDRNKNNQPQFKSFFLHVDPDEYFNPASTVKLPVALLSLERLESLKRYGISRNTAMLTDSSYSSQSAVISDTSSENGLPSVAQYIRKIFLVSDNDAYNRLYEFLGQQYLNETLWKKGYNQTRITRRFVPMNEDENRHTNAIRFGDGPRQLVLDPQVSKAKFDFSRKVYVGTKHYDRNEQLVDAPMEFTTHNKLGLEDLQQFLQAALFPASLPAKKRFNISADNLRFMQKYMSQLPFESKHPKYDTSEFFNSYTKFFMYRAGKSKIPPGIRVFNKAGWSYGFLTDASYIVDFNSGIELMLAATIYVNSDGVLNDDKYDYEQIGYPFFQEIGQIIYNYERSRSRAHRPALKDFVFDYNQ